MVSLASLWLPIVLTAVAIFVLSIVMWMLLPHHKSDFKKLAREDEVTAALRAAGVKAGQYIFPHCADSKEMRKPEFMKKWQDGPTGMLIVRPTGDFPMGASMVQTVLFTGIVALLVGYVATIAFRAGDPRMDVFRSLSVVAWLAFSGAQVWKAIWAAQSWSETIKSLADGLVYGLATGAIFAWRWPGLGG